MAEAAVKVFLFEIFCVSLFLRGMQVARQANFRQFRLKHLRVLLGLLPFTHKSIMYA
jgi:hypothetical protein